jgi:hypothetical protein
VFITLFPRRHSHGLATSVTVVVVMVVMVVVHDGN